MVDVGMSFSDASCPVPDVRCPGSYCLSMKWLMHCIYIMLMCLQLHTSHRCFYPRTFFKNSKLKLVIVLYRVMFLATIFYRGASGFVTGFPCCVWGCGLTTCDLYVTPFDKSALSKLVCKFDRMECSISLLYKYILILIIDIYYHLGISVWATFIFISWIYFKFAYVLCTSIPYRRDTYSF